jgi:hypothetical protein
MVELARDYPERALDLAPSPKPRNLLYLDKEAETGA